GAGADCRKGVSGTPCGETGSGVAAAIEAAGRAEGAAGRGVFTIAVAIGGVGIAFAIIGVAAGFGVAFAMAGVATGFGVGDSTGTSGAGLAPMRTNSLGEGVGDADAAGTGACITLASGAVFFL